MRHKTEIKLRMLLDGPANSYEDLLLKCFQIRSSQLMIPSQIPKKSIIFDDFRRENSNILAYFPVRNNQFWH